MTTIINTPPNQNSDEGTGVGLIVGIITVVLLGILFFIYVLPMLQGGEEEQLRIGVHVPATTPPVTASGPAE